MTRSRKPDTKEADQAEDVLQRARKNAHEGCWLCAGNFVYKPDWIGSGACKKLHDAIDKLYDLANRP